MDEVVEYQGMVPYPMIFPEVMEGIIPIVLPRKVGKAKAGEYQFIEAYCVEKGCDCRRVDILVVSAKGKLVAAIEFGFDPEDPLAGPFLNEFEKQSAAAEDLLDVFVEAVNDNPAWLKEMYQHYRQVRKKVDGRVYRGKPFPKPGSVERFKKPPEEEDPFASFEELVKAAVRTPPQSKRRKKVDDPAQGELFPELAPSAVPSLDDFLNRYRHLVSDEGFSMDGDLQSDLRRYVLDRDEAGEEMAQLLLRHFAQAETDEEGYFAALRLLFDILDMLRIELERNRPGARQRMERWQEALARHIYAKGVDPQVGAEVTRVLIDARVEILPLLHEANSRRMFEGLDAEADFVPDPEQAMLDLLGELEAEGAANPHELFEAILQMMAVGDVEVQTNLCRLMLGIEHPVVREAAALMLFHPQAEVRAGVAQVLAEADGRCLTPETLRRLIVARNWFPESLRRLIDQAVTNARRARVECAPLPKRVSMTVHASSVDGAMAQTFQVILPVGKSFLCCSIMPKKSSGVADAFLIPLASKRERSEFLALLGRETGAVEVAVEYLHKRICQALADGALHDKVPCHWLVAIAERLGCDQWKAVPLDVTVELAALCAELERRGGRFATEGYRLQALVESAAWAEEQSFAWSWFEDDAEVDALVKKAQGRKRYPDPDRCLVAILEKVLQPRRVQWLERLVLAALWLKVAKKPPVPWQQMVHVAAAVADENLPLIEIPLMVMIAGHSFGAYMDRLDERA